MDAPESLEGQKEDAAKPSRLRKWKWLCVVGVLALAVYGSIRFMSAGPHGISERAYDRIQLGMTEEEVTGVIGLPPGIYARNWTLQGGIGPQPHSWECLSWEGDPAEGDYLGGFEGQGINWLWWEGQGIAIQLVVDDSGKVVGKGLFWYKLTPRPDPDPVWLRWLKRLLP